MTDSDKTFYRLVIIGLLLFIIVTTHEIKISINVNTKNINEEKLNLDNLLPDSTYYNNANTKNLPDTLGKQI